MNSQYLKSVAIASITGIVSVLIVLFLISSFGLSFPLYVNQIVTNKNDYFSVTAEATTYAKPDIAVINVGYSTEGPSVTQVQNQANTVINKIISDLKTIGIEEKDIQTTNYNLRPNYDYQSGTQKITGYAADINLKVKARDLEIGNQVVDIATRDGANQVGGISFEVDDIEKYRAEARIEAIKKAKSKAIQLAKDSGITLGKIINVYESPVEPPYYPLGRADALTGESPQLKTDLQPGQTEVKVSVTLGYVTK